MARETARNLYAKVRAKRRGVPRPRYQPLHIADSNSQQSVSSATANNIEDSMQPSTSTKKRIRLTRNAIAQSNWKITDFFAVLSKGRENVLKSPQQIVRAQRATNRLRHSLKPNNNAVLVTLSDSDNDDEDNQDDSIAQGQSQGDRSEEENKEIKFKVEPSNIHLNQMSPEYDEEIQIVTMLPPIPQRDHPLLELED